MRKTDEELITRKLRDLCAVGIVVHTGVQFVLPTARTMPQYGRKPGARTEIAQWAKALLRHWMP